MNNKKTKQTRYGTKDNAEKSGAQKGRPPRLLEESVKNSLLMAIKLGMSYERAAVFAGISPTTWGNWMKWAEEEPESVYGELLREIKKAEVYGELANLHIISKASEKQWQAAAWLLERRNPERWGRIYHHHQIRGQIEHEHKHAFDMGERVERIARLLERARARRDGQSAFPAGAGSEE